MMDVFKNHCIYNLLEKNKWLYHMILHCVVKSTMNNQHVRNLPGSSSLIRPNYTHGAKYNICDALETLYPFLVL